MRLVISHFLFICLIGGCDSAPIANIIVLELSKGSFKWTLKWLVESSNYFLNVPIFRLWETKKDRREGKAIIWTTANHNNNKKIIIPGSYEGEWRKPSPPFDICHCHLI